MLGYAQSQPHVDIGQVFWRRRPSTAKGDRLVGGTIPADGGIDSPVSEENLADGRRRLGLAPDVHPYRSAPGKPSRPSRPGGSRAECRAPSRNARPTVGRILDAVKAGPRHGTRSPYSPAPLQLSGLHRGQRRGRPATERGRTGSARTSLPSGPGAASDHELLPSSELIR